MDRLNLLKAFAKTANKRYGLSTVDMGARAKAQQIPRIETGSLQLDYVLGGGLPYGRTTMLYGEKSSGKTSTAYRIAGMAQDLCANCLRRIDVSVKEVPDPETGEVEWAAIGHCECFNDGLFVPRQYPDEKKDVYEERLARYVENSYEEFRIAIFDMEAAYDGDWAKRVGLDDRRALYVCPDTAEECIDIYDSLMRTGAVDLFVLDSIAAMTPSKEVEESVEKWQQGLQARLVNKFVRKVQASSNATAREYGRTPTQIWINQVRQKIGVMFGDPTTVPGGKGQGFATSVEVKLWASSYESGDDERLKIAEKVVVNFKVQKNKTAPPKGQGSYVLRLSGPKGGSVDETKLIISLCEKYGQIEKSGAKWNLGMNSFKTKGALIQHLETDMIERERVRKYLLKRMLDL